MMLLIQFRLEGKTLQVLAGRVSTIFWILAPAQSISTTRPASSGKRRLVADMEVVLLVQLVGGEPRVAETTLLGISPAGGSWL